MSPGSSHESRLPPGDERVKGRHAVVFAFACAPGAGSEPGVGWQTVRAAALAVERVTVITRASDGRDLERALAGFMGRVEVRRVGSAHLANANLYLRYVDWIFRAAREARQVPSAQIYHHATYASDWLPTPFSAMRKRKHERWVVGPVGGATRAPIVLSASLGWRALIVDTLRSAVGALGRSLNRWTLRGRADILIAQNRDTAGAWHGNPPAIVRPNVVVNYEQLTKPRPFDSRAGALFVGRGLYWKGLPIAIAALAHLPSNWRLTVIGPGNGAIVAACPEGLRDRILLLGSVSHSEAIRLMGEAEVVMFPSLHDSAGWAAAEAAAVGTPVVCLDLGGVATVAGSLAVPVEARPVGTLPQRFAEATRRAATVPREPDHRWSFESYAQFIAECYEVH